MPKSKKHENTSAVFRLRPINRNNRAVIKYVGMLTEEEKLGDEIIELDKPLHPEFDLVGKHAIPIKDIGEFEMVGRLYRCNIVGSYLIGGKRYPLMYMSIEYSRPMVSGALFQIFYSIDMNKDEKKLLEKKKPSAYVNLQFSGKWVQHMDCDDELKEKYEELLSDMLESDGARELYNNCSDKVESMSEEQIVDWVNEYVSRERVYYDILMQGQNMEFASLTKLRDYYIELCQSNRFYKFLEIAMKCREIHRRREAGIEDDVPYIVPKNVTKMNDVRQKLIDDNELILEEE